MEWAQAYFRHVFLSTSKYCYQACYFAACNISQYSLCVPYKVLVTN